jgi:6-pyruvoyltetrahydropterin/6-carboxytetrahydropterin synthase
MVYFTRRYRFSAAHRLHAPGLSDEENARLYGKCNNPLGHGHNYALEVTVGGRVDPATGMVCDLGFLDALVQREVLERFDEVHLNLDTDNFRERVPTSENICQEIYRLLASQLKGAGPGQDVHLSRVRLEETSSNAVEYLSADFPEAAGQRRRL